MANFLFWFFVGILFGVCITVLIYRLTKTCGTLLIDQSNPEKDIYRMEFDSLKKLSKKKRVLLRIDSNADLSQK